MLDAREADVEAATHALAERQRVKAIFEEERAAAAARESRGAARVDLELQMEEKKAAQKEARAAFLAEREAVDAVAAKIREEDDAELMRKAQKVRDTQTWVKKFLSPGGGTRGGEAASARGGGGHRALAEELRGARRRLDGRGKREEADTSSAATKEKEENDRRRRRWRISGPAVLRGERGEVPVGEGVQGEATGGGVCGDDRDERAPEGGSRDATGGRGGGGQFRKVMFERFAEQDRLEQVTRRSGA